MTANDYLKTRAFYRMLGRSDQSTREGRRAMDEGRMADANRLNRAAVRQIQAAQRISMAGAR